MVMACVSGTITPVHSALERFGRQSLAHARRESGHAVDECSLAGSGKRSGRWVALKQVEHGGIDRGAAREHARAWDGSG